MRGVEFLGTLRRLKRGLVRFTNVVVQCSNWVVISTLDRGVWCIMGIWRSFNPSTRVVPPSGGLLYSVSFLRGLGLSVHGPGRRRSFL